jgi:hypothetical protein
LTEAQIAALEKAKADKEAHGEFESECPGYCGAQDTFYPVFADTTLNAVSTLALFVTSSSTVSTDKAKHRPPLRAGDDSRLQRFTLSSTLPIGPSARRSKACGNHSNGKTRSTNGRAPDRASLHKTSCQAACPSSGV